jgi:hypothetical protein
MKNKIAYCKEVGVLTSNILARMSEELQFPYCKRGAESGDNSKPNPLASLLFNSSYQLQRYKNYDLNSQLPEI